jgi:Family of unknown function (DUF6308)
MSLLRLPSGCVIERPAERMLAFCRNEFAYYDALPSADPNHIDPLDVLATVAMNSRVDTAKKVRQVHEGLASLCDPLLPSIPEDANLLDIEKWHKPLRDLLDAAVRTPGVLVATATKVLHRKRRFLIPMLDSVVLRHYLAGNPASLRACIESDYKSKAADGAMDAVVAFHRDLVAAQTEIESIRQSLAHQGYSLSPVRILEVLIWTEMEPGAGYRSSLGG